MSRRALLALLLLLIVGFAGWRLTARAPVAVSLARVERGTVLESLDEDGLVRSDVEADLAAPASGRLERFLVRTGDRVRAGQPVAIVEQGNQQAAVDRAQAEVRAAQTALEQAARRAAAEDAAAAAEVRSSQAATDAAAARLRTVQEGSRRQEVATAEAALEQARATWDEARSALRRAQRLLDEGYIPPAEVEAAQAREASARATRDQAASRLSLAREGARASEVEAAQAEHERALAGQEGAQARVLQAEAAAREVEAAEARVQAARANLEGARAGLSQTEVRAPRAGVITLEEVEPGETVGPQTRLARVVDPSRIWVEILVDENDRGKVKPGQEVQLLSDAWPDRPAKGRLAALDAYAQLKRTLRGTPTQDEDRVFRARVDLEPGGPPLHPGMSVFAEVILRRLEGVLFVPREAVVTREGRWLVFVARNGRAEERVLDVGVRDVERVEVRKGVSEGEEVVLNPGTLQDGARLR